MSAGEDQRHQAYLEQQARRAAAERARVAALAGDPAASAALRAAWAPVLAFTRATAGGPTSLPGRAGTPPHPRTGPGTPR